MVEAYAQLQGVVEEQMNENTHRLHIRTHRERARESESESERERKKKCKQTKSEKEMRRVAGGQRKQAHFAVTHTRQLLAQRRYC